MTFGFARKFIRDWSRSVLPIDPKVPKFSLSIIGKKFLNRVHFEESKSKVAPPHPIRPKGVGTFFFFKKKEVSCPLISAKVKVYITRHVFSYCSDDIRWSYFFSHCSAKWTKYVLLCYILEVAVHSLSS